MTAAFEVIRDVEYRAGDEAHAGQRFDLFRPTAPRLPGAFLYLHGGGWRYGDKSTSERIPAALASAGITTLNANYTLTTEHPYPRNVDDVLALIAYVGDRSSELGLDAGSPVLGIGGSSAGGHLASLAVTKGLAEGRLAALPGAVVSWYAPLDPASRYLKHRYPDAPRPGGFWDRGGAEPPEPRDPFVPFIGTADLGSVTLREALDGDPRLHLADLAPERLPPFLLLVGTDDSEEIRYSQRTWHAALRSIGADSTLLEVAGADHADPLFSSPPLIGAAIGHLAAACAAADGRSGGSARLQTI
ncbi:alpha/beta hydrolase [Leucobacter sp. CSA1]|uniref:Alpha/beta hydrolase n=1 Tax=Leucobacter chromiisoli TaxID=2796471 RepID=A0A934QA15_9MICO|nr:alpha/beta hydrolase [Leucobacter chromiisoli]MBK0419287.1 alpha/beta hydrolase [Leucobacter chromiisoli]